MQISKAQILKVEKGEVKATFRLPIEVMKDLKYRAIDENKPVNTLVIEALRNFLGGKPKKNGGKGRGETKE